MLSTSPDMRNSHPHYLFHSTSQRFRQIREKPIMGIDYTKLCGGSSKYIQNNASACCYSPNSSSQMFFQPKDSILKNQTASSFRSNQQRSSFQHRPSISQQKLRLSTQKQQSTNQSVIPPSQQQNIMRASTNSLPAQDSQDQYDFETFKKYSKEFQEFRQQKQRLLQTAEQKRNFLNKSANVRVNSEKEKIIQDENGSSNQNQTKQRREDSRSREQNQLNPQKQARQLRMMTEQSNEQKNQKNMQTQSSYLDTEQPQIIEDAEQALAATDAYQENQQTNNNNNNCNQTSQDFKGSQSSSKVFQESEGAYGGEDSQHTFDPNSTQYSKMVTNYFDKNSDYYKHLRGDCLCARCICGKCKCSYKGMPVDLKNSMQSMYMQDFQRFKSLDQLPSITMDFHTQPNGTGHIKCLSTTQSDFKSHDVKEPQRYKGPQQAKTAVPFFATTNYQNNFIDWRSQATCQFRPPLEATVVHAAPFVGKTVYADSFYRKDPRDKEFEEFIKSKSKSSLKSPMNPDFRYAAETTNQKFFKGFSTTNKTPTLVPYQYQAGITPAPPNQYKSEAMQEYEDKSQIVCPSRLALMERNRQRKLEKDSEFVEREKLKALQEKFPPTINQILSSTGKHKQTGQKL